MNVFCYCCVLDGLVNGIYDSVKKLWINNCSILLVIICFLGKCSQLVTESRIQGIFYTPNKFQELDDVNNGSKWMVLITKLITWVNYRDKHWGVNQFVLAELARSRFQERANILSKQAKRGIFTYFPTEPSVCWNKFSESANMCVCLHSTANFPVYKMNSYINAFKCFLTTLKSKFTFE